MESIVVHTKNATELQAVKTMLKDMNIEFEKFHTNTFHNKKTVKKIQEKNTAKIVRKSKPRG